MTSWNLFCSYVDQHKNFQTIASLSIRVSYLPCVRVYWCIRNKHFNCFSLQECSSFIYLNKPPSGKENRRRVCVFNHACSRNVTLPGICGNWPDWLIDRLRFNKCNICKELNSTFGVLSVALANIWRVVVETTIIICYTLRVKFRFTILKLKGLISGGNQRFTPSELFREQLFLICAIERSFTVCTASSKDHDHKFLCLRLSRQLPSSETQGRLVGAGKSLNGREKNSGEEFLTFLRPIFFLARLDFFLPPLTAPGSRRMVISGLTEMVLMGG